MDIAKENRFGWDFFLLLLHVKLQKHAVILILGNACLEEYDNFSSPMGFVLKNPIGIFARYSCLC